MAEQLICNQQVDGSTPFTSSSLWAKLNMGAFPSGQRGQTVNLLALPSVVRIHPLPPKSRMRKRSGFFSLTPVLWDFGKVTIKKNTIELRNPMGGLNGMQSYRLINILFTPLENILCGCLSRKEYFQNKVQS